MLMKIDLLYPQKKGNEKRQKKKKKIRENTRTIQFGNHFDQKFDLKW